MDARDLKRRVGRDTEEWHYQKPATTEEPRFSEAVRERGGQLEGAPAHRLEKAGGPGQALPESTGVSHCLSIRCILGDIQLWEGDTPISFYRV